MRLYLLIAAILALVLPIHSSPLQYDEDPDTALRKFLERVNNDLADIYNEDYTASFNYEIHERNQDLVKAAAATKKFMEYVRQINTEAEQFKHSQINDYNLYRQLEKLPKLGYNALDKEELEEIQEASGNMSMIYKTVQLCEFKNPTICNLTLIPGIQDTLHISGDLEEIEYYWLEWKKRTGSGLKDSFRKFIDLYQKTAELNGFEKPSKMWFKNFEEDNILDVLEGIMEKIKPFFEEFHAYVRFLLRQKFGPDLIKPNQPYPQHLAELFLGEAYTYLETGRFMFPYEETGLPNITEALKAQGYTVEKLFEDAVDFCTSIGLPIIPHNFLKTNGEKVAKPEEQILGCWNKAWNFFGSKKIKISYCPEVSFRKYMDMHEVVSNIQYYQFWKDQPTIFQSEPLPNFSEMIGKVISMSASTPKHLELVGIIQEGTFNDEARLNRLYLEGMQQLFVLPVLYVLDKYRVQVFDGEIQTWDNCGFWDLNEKYIGARPPVERSPNDFDPPSKLLVGVDDEYSSVIVTIIAQFQIYKHFCEITEEYIPGDPDHTLDNCDFSLHIEPGRLLREAMELGSSRPWRDVLEILTGTRELDASGFLEYFEPLFKWLQKQNSQSGAEVGWTSSGYCH